MVTADRGPESTDSRQRASDEKGTPRTPRSRSAAEVSA